MFIFQARNQGGLEGSYGAVLLSLEMAQSQASIFIHAVRQMSTALCDLIAYTCGSSYPQAVSRFYKPFFEQLG